jgi:hypothetical protein
MHAARIHLSLDGLSIETFDADDNTISLMRLKTPTVVNQFIHAEIYVNEGNANRVLGPLQIDVQCDDMLLLRENPSPEEETNRDVLGRETVG